jgi:hypothetical protein
MNSLDYIKKLYKGSKSSVVVVNATGTVFWSTNLERLGLQEDDFKGRRAVHLFGTSIHMMYPGEYVLHIRGMGYTYTVNTYSDRNNDYTVLQISLHSIPHYVVEDYDIANLMDKRYKDMEKYATELVNLVERLNLLQTPVSKEDYDSVVGYTRNILSIDRGLANVLEMRKNKCFNRDAHVNLSETVQGIAEECCALLRKKDVNVELNCVEDIYTELSAVTIYNLCLAMTKRVMCICRGAIDQLSFTIDMVSDSDVDLTVSTNNDFTGKFRMPKANELWQKYAISDTIGSDLFVLRYFCMTYNTEARQKSGAGDNVTFLRIRVPRCHSQGIKLFTCKGDVSPDFHVLSKIAIEMEDIISYISDPEPKPEAAVEAASETESGTEE